MIKSLKSKISSYLRVPESIPPHFVPVKELISTIDTSVIQGLIAELVGPGERTSFADDGFISQSLTTLLIFLSIDEEAEFIPIADVCVIFVHGPEEAIALVTSVEAIADVCTNYVLPLFQYV